jgi:hypothetical protein
VWILKFLYSSLLSLFTVCILASWNFKFFIWSKLSHFYLKIRRLLIELMTSFNPFEDLQLCFFFLDYKDVLSAHIWNRFFASDYYSNTGQTTLVKILKRGLEVIIKNASDKKKAKDSKVSELSYFIRLWQTTLTKKD